MRFMIDFEEYRHVVPEEYTPAFARKRLKRRFQHGWTYLPGASLRAWREIFPQATVTGLDVDSEAMVQDGPSLQSHTCNTMNSTQVREVLEGQLFDLVVDDGLHT